jgi:molybdate/tungstate transport system substrate-binding protein
MAPTASTDEARSGPRRAPARRAAAVVSALLVLGLTNCGGGATTARHTGPVDVLYAGSLLDLMQQRIGPAFAKATGDTLDGFSAGSAALANEIKGRVQRADVFISAAPSVNRTLEGSGNGDWVSWYVTFGRSPLVLGYNPSSAFARALRTKPWYEVVGQPGFLLGRTDPATDPKGVLAVEALDRAARAHHLPMLASLAASSSDVFPETTLVGRLQAGQFDAAFLYRVEAAAAHIPTVSLSGVDLQAAETVTILNRAPHPAAARAFVVFLLGPPGRRLVTEGGITALNPVAVTGRSHLPSGVKAILDS